MRFRTLLVTAFIVAGFVYYTTQPNSMLRRAWNKDSGQSWSGPGVTHSAGLGSDELNNIDVYKNAKDSVVYVTSTVYQTTFFFEQVPVREMGSGFLVNEDGEILTNNHVISGSSQIEVTLPDQSRYKARILVRLVNNDLALIKIDPKKKLRYLHLGDSDGLQVGQKVMAIGNPFGFLQGTLTVGVVSSLGRTIQSEEGHAPLEGMIQTDAAINSGNSGGPLIDSQGNVIGINTAIYGPNGGNVGIGFAMPINRARAMLEDFRAGRKPARLGVSTVYVAGDLAEALRLPSSGGLLIQQVARGSAADRAGLRGATDVVGLGNLQQLGVGGDLITEIDGKPVAEQDAIIRILSRKHAGDAMDMKVYRGGRTMSLKVTLSEAAEEKF
jgi:S1-C subfamily serine protease